MQTLFSDSVLKCSRASLYLSALSVVDEIDQKNFICQPLLYALLWIILLKHFIAEVYIEG